MNLADIVDTRHTVKAFDAGRALPQATVDQLLAVLHKSPSSVNSQPWHFVVAATPQARARMARATADHHAYNAAKIQDASHVIALCVRTDMNDGPTCIAMTCATCSRGWPTRSTWRWARC